MDRAAKTGGGTTELGFEALAEMGLGPDAPLLNDPKVFLDARFLASLISELETELGPEGAAQALFHIGAAHGVRDAQRALGRGVEEPPPARPMPAVTSLVMQLAPCHEPGAGLAFEGEWPEAHEAQARLAKSGRSPRPACSLSAGYTSGWLSETHDLDIAVVEESCAAVGAEACRFRAVERQDFPEHAPSEGPLVCLDRTRLPSPAPEPFAPARPDGETSAVLDPEDDAVHVWGPVMVLPFTRPDDALATIHMLGRDRATIGVRAVVVDLRLQPLDPGYGAEMLAQTLEAIELWGAEAILTGLCDLSAPIVAELGAAAMLQHKDLAEAVATAFQIAEAQRHPL